MNIEKMKNGKYRIRQQSNGVRHTLILDHRPTVAEATILLAEVIEADPTCKEPSALTFEGAALKYIASKSRILSPSTIRSYKSMIRNMPASFRDMKIRAIQPIDIQTVINDYSADHSPKSVANLYGFICPIMTYFRPNMKISCTMPQRLKKEPYIPTEEDVKRIFEAFRGTKYEVPISLAAMGLRRSEICALTINDLNPDDGSLYISKALVQDENEKFVVKTTKTTDSTRTIVLPPHLVTLIEEQGYIYRGHPESISRALKVVLKDLGIPDFSLHKLRHFFASYLHNKGYTDKQIQAMGGWRSDVMKRVYTHAMDMEETRQEVANALQGFYT